MNQKFKKMHAISNFCTALSAQNLNAPVEKIVEIEKSADNAALATSKSSVENLHKTTEESFSGMPNKHLTYKLSEPQVFFPSHLKFEIPFV